jgi:hypothetical protein
VTTPAATGTQHSKHRQQPQITHHAPACRSTPADTAETPRHAISEYLQANVVSFAVQQIANTGLVDQFTRRLSLTEPPQQRLYRRR